MSPEDCNLDISRIYICLTNMICADSDIQPILIDVKDEAWSWICTW